MRYKADYAPSQLLCPQTGTWVSVKEGVPRLVKRSPERCCATLVDDPESFNGNSEDCSSILDNAHIQVSGRQFRVCELAPEGQTYLKPILEPFARKAGKDATLDCLIDLG